MSRDETRGSGAKKALNHQIFMVGYLEFLKTKHLKAALFSAGYRASTLARQLYRRLSLISKVQLKCDGKS
jgi:hypothetical protein